MMEVGRQHHGGGKHGTRIATSARFVDACFYNAFLVI
jgi:hypothetical protein